MAVSIADRAVIRRTVPDDLDGERADKIVAVLGEMSRREARDLCDAGMVRRAGAMVSARDRLSGGEVIEYESPEPAPPLVAEEVPFAIRYEDPYLLVVDKPAGVVVHPGAGVSSGTLAAGLFARYPELGEVGEPGRAGLVHRLDRDTSGLLVVARDDDTHRALTQALAAREIGRKYLALVNGGFEVPRGTIDAPIAADPDRPSRRWVVADGRPARTHYRVVESLGAASLLEVTLETGRTHQIRVHLASIGRPVVADPVYGGPDPIECPRIFLHAARLELTHPVTGVMLAVESPLPDDLAEVLDRLR